MHNTESLEREACAAVREWVEEAHRVMMGKLCVSDDERERWKDEATNAESAALALHVTLVGVRATQSDVDGVLLGHGLPMRPQMHAIDHHRFTRLALRYVKKLQDRY